MRHLHLPLDLICSDCGCTVDPQQVRVFLGAGHDDVEPTWACSEPGCDCDVCRTSFCPECLAKQTIKQTIVLGPEVGDRYYAIRGWR
jgi:hypothetical protein